MSIFVGQIEVYVRFASDAKHLGVSWRAEVSFIRKRTSRIYTIINIRALALHDGTHRVSANVPTCDVRPSSPLLGF